MRLSRRPFNFHVASYNVVLIDHHLILVHHRKPKTSEARLKIQPFATEQYFSLYEFNAPYPLSCSDCETMTVSELLEFSQTTIEEFGSLRLGYTESQGDAGLRESICELYFNISPEDVVVLTSPIEGIYLTMRTLLAPGDEVISLTPAYDALNNVVEHVCGNVVPWHIQPTDQGWKLDFDQFERLVSDKTRLAVVNFPHNPTGYAPSNKDFERMLQILDRHHVWLFCDEMYRGLELNPMYKIPSAIESYSRCLVLSGLSKTYGLPGLRMGWLVIPDHEIRDQLINWKHYTSICPAAPSEKLAIAALKVHETLRDRNVELVKHNLDIADQFFKRWPDHFVWRRPEAGSIGLVEMKLDAFGSSNVNDYCHRLVKETGVLLLPGDGLGCSQPFVRFGFGRKNFAECLSAYETYLQS